MHGAQQTQAGLWRARHKAGKTTPQPPDIERVKAVDVFCGVDGGDHLLSIDLPWQRELNKHAVDALVGIELLDLRYQGLLRDVGGQAKLE